MIYRKRLFWPIERKLLRRLMSDPGQIITHEELLAAMGRGNHDIGCLRQYISRLRQKIEKDPALPDIIITHRGQGYSFQQEQRR